MKYDFILLCLTITSQGITTAKVLIANDIKMSDATFYPIGERANYRKYESHWDFNNRRERQ